MLPGDGIGDVDKSCFTTNAEYKFKYGSEGLNTSEIKEYIRNPHKFNINGGMDGRYYNLWSTDNERTDNNDDVVIKSVYDPSPVGYSLPASNAFTGFTTTGNNSSNPTEFNVKSNYDKGWYFYTKPNKKGTTTFFPASAYRDYNSNSLRSTYKEGGYWVAGTNTKYFGYYSCFSSKFIYTLYNLNDNYRSCGLPVRSAEEKEWRKVDVGCRDLQCADFRYASSSPHNARVHSIYDVMDDTVTQCNSYNTQED